MPTGRPLKNHCLAVCYTQNQEHGEAKFKSIEIFRCGVSLLSDVDMSPCITAWWKNRTMKPGCCWRPCILWGHSTGEKPCVLQMQDAQAKGLGSVRWKPNAWSYTLCVRLVRPAYSLTKTLTNQYTASWFVFSLYFLEAERVCPQTTFIFSSCKFYFSVQLWWV